MIMCLIDLFQRFVPQFIYPASERSITEDSFPSDSDPGPSSKKYSKAPPGHRAHGYGVSLREGVSARKYMKAAGIVPFTSVESAGVFYANFDKSTLEKLLEDENVLSVTENRRFRAES